MSTQTAFTIEQFYKFLSEGKLMAAKCQKCGKIHLPPRPICDNCYSQDFVWKEVSGKSKLLTYTVIYVAPAQFQALAPYAVGIVQLENGLKLPGVISGVPHDKLKVGMDLAVDFEACAAGQAWPQWQRYCFKPVNV
ncbi:MAG: Zn-ribbon domain-containing OB-fold protein [Candidatus Bathyarchaeota archaeon]|nr:Zn-ribbon domain-containing OB-fold protein [Candidatus Bathyarchaeota archaeon]